MNDAFFLAREKLNHVTPLKRDCGRICGARCCRSCEGEETGMLDKMLNSTADSYEYESQAAINKLITIMQPVMIVILAGLVLVVIGSVMLPIFSMYSNIEGASDPGAGLEAQAVIVKDISEWEEI